MTMIVVWIVSIIGASYWAIGEILAGRWSWRRVNLRRAARTLAAMRRRAARERP
jgi:hypothetical protein